MKRTSWRVVASGCFAVLLAVIGIQSLSGQATEGSILGILRDPSGAVVNHASVQVANVETGVIRSTETNETGEYVVSNLPPGSYAIQTFQDINANDKMDTSWLGLPLEPFGFSRDATPFLSKPSFDEVKFTLEDGEHSQVLHLQNTTTKSPSNKARDAIRARQRQ